ncbi:MAG: hypothetical protein IPM22_01635 [Betaproteobacteria bacterium]|jgi:hypothetical protein|nr:hypothetical protein [Betaproteobacteria bacterium]MCC7217986.1 hypothetical protein [Burkholderiales bacterium]
MFARTIVVAAFAFIPAVALAQAPAPAAAPPEMAKCEKPDAHPGRLASDQKRRQWGNEVIQWQKCAKAVVEAISAKADAAVKAANAAVAESNAAINAYNEQVKEYQAQADAAR